MIDAFFIAGTDTDVGKTVASKAILQALAAKNLTTIGYKPVAAGSDNTELGMRNSDALHLMRVATESAQYTDVNPYALELATSPHIAARHAQIEIDFKRLSEKLSLHKSHCDMVVVEGAGGWRVPVSDTRYLSEWVQSEQLPVVLVVGIKLGCLSHACLTAEAIRGDGLNIIGWVANRINPGTEHYPELIRKLQTTINAPKLGEIPYIASAKRSELARFIDVKPLLAI
jgi:dethiobiotin synthetase